MSHLKNCQKINLLLEQDSVKYVKFCTHQRNWEAMLQCAETNSHVTTIRQNCALNIVCRLRADYRGQERLQIEPVKMQIAYSIFLNSFFFQIL